jgi:2-polyprenyl-3-methyl-5-hydroxy-6-metoxy-1,4-benzoquinol methylase
MVQREISQLNPGYWKDHGRDELTFWKPFVKILRARSKILGNVHSKRCLDVGCLYGTLLIYASKLGWVPYGIDLSNRINPVLLHKFGIRYVRSDIECENIPWEGKFDVIIFTEILEHLKFNPMLVLAKMHDCLSEDGVLLLSTPDKTVWWGEGIFKGPFEELPGYTPSKRTFYH